MLTIGCHLSAANGYLAMGKDAVSIGANTFQFFTRNPRGGQAKPIDPQDITDFLAFAKKHGITTILAHAAYTLNMCSADESIRAFAQRTIADDLQRMECTPNNLYNIHPGSHVKQGVEQGITFIQQALNQVLSENYSTTLLLETMAGKGSEIGRNFAEIKMILDGIKLDHKVGVCLDTCHVWEAGYDIVNDLDAVLAEFDKTIGLDRLKAIHLNDSINVMGAAKDRHAKIGAGQIGLKALSKVINHPQLKHLPFFLETPHKDLTGYAQEITLLKSVYQQ